MVQFLYLMLIKWAFSKYKVLIIIEASPSQRKLILCLETCRARSPWSSHEIHMRTWKPAGFHTTSKTRMHNCTYRPVKSAHTCTPHWFLGQNELIFSSQPEQIFRTCRPQTNTYPRIQIHVIRVRLQLLPHDSQVKNNFSPHCFLTLLSKERSGGGRRHDKEPADELLMGFLR